MAGRLGDIHPALQIVGFAVATRAALHQRADAAAVRVPQDDDAADPQLLHRDLYGGQHALQAAVGAGGRHQVGHIAHGEDGAGVAAQQHGRVHAGIAAADQQGAGVLAVTQVAIQRGRLFVVQLLIALEAGDEAFDVSHLSPPSAP
ncbi:hypothetical protein G6F59_016928 [Rhizopus arrhizus]|nr:hypothetical protein G6F59_016928 [Rhizopus arrhizus]